MFRVTVCEETTQIELSSEIKMSLSFISSGCLAVLIDDKTAFVLKESQSEIEMLRDIEQILFGLECIKRLEFPSVRMYFEIRDRENKPYQFDCFFGIESDEEVRLLSKLKDQDSFNIILFDAEIGYSRRVKISEEQREKIKSVLDEAGR
ncbi:MAG: hypothetical protein ACM3SR_12430 [Ignavibacteriales bacterium]